jgi:hypothetical protein
MNWIKGQIRRNAIRTIQETSGRYLFPDDQDVLDTLRRLRAGIVKSIDLTHHRRENEGHHYG